MIDGMINAHNGVRNRLGLPGLAWSDELAASARHWADQLANEYGCAMKHSKPDGDNGSAYGENLYWASAIRWSDGKREPRDVTPDEVVQAWAEEEADYSLGTNSCRTGRVCGHYTQIVWRDTRYVGCARRVCADSGQIWVCQYSPAGNIVGKKPY